jgi:hypothetical protein
MAEIRKMDRMAREILADSMASSIYGDCYDLALALYRDLDCELIGITDGKTIIHAGVILPDGKIYDGRGEVSAEEFLKPFKADGREMTTDVKEESLIASEKVTEDKIEFYLCRAQMLWPNLPWKTKTKSAGILDFLKDLEELSKKHKIWIRSSLTSVKPVLCEYQGDESYFAEPCIDGVNFFFDRSLVN